MCAAGDATGSVTGNVKHCRQRCGVHEVRVAVQDKIRLYVCLVDIRNATQITDYSLLFKITFLYTRDDVYGKSKYIPTHY